MDYKGISELIEVVNKSSLTHFEMENAEIKVIMKKEPLTIENTIMPNIEKPRTSQVIKQEVTTDVLEENVESEIRDGENTVVVTSPIVGVFYAASSPELDPFVSVGSKVKKGDMLCIIEAMKLMNEIECEYDGEIVDIFVKNEQMVEYGQPILRIKTTGEGV